MISDTLKSTHDRAALLAFAARTLLTIFFLGCFALAARGQSAEPAARPDRGIGSIGSYSVSSIENVNLTNGNVNVSIPLASLPPMAGGKLSWTLRAIYNSKVWDMRSIEQLPDSQHQNRGYTTQQLNISESGGWKIGDPYQLIDQRADADVQVQCGTDQICIAEAAFKYKMVLATPDGSRHELRPMDAALYNGSQGWRIGYYAAVPDTLNPPQAMRYYSFDGSFLWAVIYPTGNAIRWEVYQPDGTKITQRNNGIQRIQDTNGNNIKIFSEIDGAGITTKHFQDQLTNREIKYISSFGGNGQAQYQTVGGTWISVDVIFGETSPTGRVYSVGDRVCSNWGELAPGGIRIVKSIVLPQSEGALSPRRQFTFGYNSEGDLQPVTPFTYRTFCNTPDIEVSKVSQGWGALSRIVMPSGASVEYDYKLDGPPLETFLTGAKRVPGATITKKRLIHDGVTDTWNYDIQNTSATVTGPDGSVTTEAFFDHDPAHAGYMGGTSGFAGLTYRTIRSGKRMVERHWIAKVFAGANTQSPDGQVGFNCVVDAEYTTLLEGGSPVTMSAKTFQYDFNGNISNVTEYDWFSPGLIGTDRDEHGVPLHVPPGAGAPLRQTATSYYSNSPSDNIYAKRVIGIVSPLIVNASQEIVSGPSKTRFSFDGLAYGMAPTVGNLTRKSLWDDRASKWLDTITVYDPSTGNRTSTRDPRNNLVSYSYTDATLALPNTISGDPLNGTGQQTKYVVYDFSTGLVISETDANGNQTTIDYTNKLMGSVDPYGRRGTVTSPPVISTVDGVTTTNQQRGEVSRYYDSQRYTELWSDLNLAGDGKLRTKTTHDNLGRVIKTESSEDGINYSISSTIIYEQMGRVTFASNPKRTAAASTDGWTRTTNDSVGRVIELATFSGAAQPPSSGTNANSTGMLSSTYDAEATTVTDQAGKSRRSIVDGLRRLKQVIEDPNGAGYVTTYGYDVLGDVTQVAQGVQTRTFTYDSLSRLREAYNPEQVDPSGVKIATSYQYDETSNLTRRDNPDGTFVTFGPYDGLNRVKEKTLSSGNTWVYSYDTGSNGKGQLVSVVRQGTTDGCYYDGFDAAGRLNASRQITSTPQGGTQTYSMSYGYNLTGAKTREIYPSGKEVRSTYDNTDRLSQISRYIGPTFDKTYASGFTYTAHGAISAISLAGGAMSEQATYNSRLQSTKLDVRRANELLLGLDFDFGTTSNNGNMLTQTIRIGGTTTPTTTFSQSFAYDGLNRLETATEAGNWSQNYGYDQYGNRWMSAGYVLPQNVGLTPQTQSAFAATTNRLVSSAYDISGNQTRDGQGRQFTYDSENRQMTFNTTAGTYSYDGEGRRVVKKDASGTTVLVYNAGGQLVAEYTNGAAQNNGTSYLTTDELGSTRVVTDASGVVKARHDYLPFGEEIPSTVGRASLTGYASNDSTRQRFGQKERDSESGLDYFLARYYSSAQGRFTSPDEFLGGPDELYHFAGDASANPTLYADLYEPQSLNKYQYGYNNPLRYVDPDGHQALSKTGGIPIPLPICPPETAKFLAEKTHEALMAVGDAEVYVLEKGWGLLKSALNRLGTADTVSGTNETITYNPPQEEPFVPNKHGSPGAPDHQEEVKRQADKARENLQPGEKVLEGKKIQGVDSTRQPDVQVVGPDGKVVRVVEVERKPNSKRNKEREAEYTRLGVPFETIPLPKRKDQ